MANEETVARQLTSIIEMLPADAQRLVSEHLPRLEALVDDEVASYGQQLSDFLDSRVGSVAAAEKSKVEAALQELSAACPADDKGEELETRARRAAVNLRQGLAEAEVLAGRGPHREAADTVVSSLREAVRRLRQDVATGFRGTGVRTFIDRLEGWHDESGRPIRLTDGELAELHKAATALPEMEDLVEVERDRNGLLDRAANAARYAGAIHERAREAPDDAGDPDQPSPETIARTLRRIQSVLDGLSNAPGGDEARSSDELRTLARSAKQAALNLDREMRIQAIGIVTRFADAWHKGQPAARNQSAIESARAACAKASAFYGAYGVLDRALAECATQSIQLRNDLDVLAGDVGTLQALYVRLVEERRQARMLEAGVDRLAQLVDQIAARVNERAMALDARAASDRFAVVRRELDVLTDVVATTKVNVDRAIALIEAGERFWRERDDGAEAMRRAVRDGVRAAKLPSAQTTPTSEAGN